jgi:hypothetical protein
MKNFVRPLVGAIAIALLTGGSALAQVVVDDSAEVSLRSWDVEPYVIDPGSAAFPISILVDPGSGNDVIDVSSSDANVAAELILPDGTEVTAANASSLGFGFIAFNSTDLAGSQLLSTFNLPGGHTVFVFPTGAAPGSYTVSLDTTLATDSSLVTVSYFSSSTVGVGLKTSSPIYRVGDTVGASAFVFDNSIPIQGANVATVIRQPDNPNDTPVPVTLDDAADGTPGDGVYVGFFTATTPGTFMLAARIMGESVGGVPFSRLATTKFRVIAPMAMLGPMHDNGVDDDGNGLFERVTITTDANVQLAGNYRFSVLLSTGPAGSGLDQRGVEIVVEEAQP